MNLAEILEQSGARMTITKALSAALVVILARARMDVVRRKKLWRRRVCQTAALRMYWRLATKRGGWGGARRIVISRGFIDALELTRWAKP